MTEITGPKDAQEAKDLLEQNINLYLRYFRERIKAFFDQSYNVASYSASNILFGNAEEHALYEIQITSNQIKTRDYHSLSHGPIKKIYDLEEIVNVNWDSNRMCSAFVQLNFFLQKDFINSLKTVEKFKL